MTQRITQADLDVRFEIYVSILKRLGMPHENTALVGGSGLHGNSFKLVSVKVPGGGQSAAPGTSQGFLGWTKREAYEKLGTINATLADVLHHLEG